MEIAAFVISLFALLVSGWAAYGTHRQAAAAQEQADIARGVTPTAEVAEIREQLLKYENVRDCLREDTRRHFEEHVSFEPNALLIANLIPESFGLLNLLEGLLAHPLSEVEEREIKRFLLGAEPSLAHALRNGYAGRYDGLRTYVGIRPNRYAAFDALP